MAKKQKMTSEDKPIRKTKGVDLTPEEKAIFQRVASDSSTEWESITEESVHDYDLGKSPGQIPEWAKKLKQDRKFAFRWITRDRERLDQVRTMPVPAKWWIVNATNLSHFGLSDEEYTVASQDLDPVLGCVCYVDQMLMFKPHWMFEKHQAYKQGLAEAKDASGDLAKKQSSDGRTDWISGEPAQLGKLDVVIADEDSFTAPEEEGLEDIIEA